MGPTAVLGEHLAEAADSRQATARLQIWHRGTGRRVTVTGKQWGTELLITQMMPPAVPGD
jgi:hypothetical protein